MRVPDLSRIVGRLVAPSKRRSPWLRYGLALVLPIVAITLNILIFDLQHAPYFGLFTLSVVITSLLGGLGPGLVDTIVSAVLGFLISPPAWTIRLSDSEDRVRIALFVLLGSLICLIVAVVGELQRKIDRERLALRESGNELQLILDATPSWVFYKDCENRFVRVNRAFAEIMGLPKEELEGHSCFEVYPREQAEAFWRDDKEVIASSKPKLNIEELMQSQAGERWVQTDKVPCRDAAGNVIGVIGFTADITERKRAQEAFLLSEKLAATGRLAAAIAHEVNNPLAGAMNAVYIARTNPTQANEMLTIAEQELLRAAHITQQTLGFYRESCGSQQVAIPKVVEEVLAVYATKLRNRNITVQRRIRCGFSRDGCSGEREECKRCLLINAGELRQIISNLLANGIDALSDGGVMQIRVSRLSDRVQLTLADNGCGIRPENLKRLFEPFFTTKEAFGTGLGLWITQELVRKHNGVIKVRSRKDKGTVFRLTFPQGGDKGT